MPNKKLSNFLNPVFAIFGFFLIVLIPVSVFGQTSPLAFGEGRISGKVTDEENHLIKDINLRIFAYQKGQWREGKFDGKLGEYSINLPAGDWFVGAHTEPQTGFTGSGINLPITLNSGTVISKNLVLKRFGGVISGKVMKPDGSVLQNALINITDVLSGDAELLSEETDINGIYKFLVPAGKYLIRAFSSPDNGISQEVKELTVSNGQLASISFAFKSPDRKIYGSVSTQGIPSQAFVWGWSEKGGYAETNSDALGKYEIRVKTDDVWHIKAIRTSGADVFESVETVLSVHDKDTLLDMRLSQSASLPGNKTLKFSVQNDIAMSLVNGMKVSLPANAVPVKELKVSIDPFIGPNQRALSIVGPAYDVNLYDSEGNKISKLSKSAILEVPYLASDIDRLKVKEDALTLAYWDEQASAWRSNGNSVVVKKDKIILGLFDHFSKIAVVGSQPPPPEPPPPSPEVSSVSSLGGGSVSSAPTPQIPTAPSIFNVNVVSSTQIDISAFDTIITTGENYELQRSSDGVNFAKVAEGLKPQLTFSDVGLTPGTNYFYRIISTDSTGLKSSPTNTFSARTLQDATPPVLSPNISPSFSTTETNITFTLQEAATSELRYGINSTNEFTLRQPNLVFVHSYIIPNANLLANRAYQYQIIASDVAGNKTTSPVFNFTTPNLASFIQPIQAAPAPSAEQPVTAVPNANQTQTQQPQTTQTVLTSSLNKASIVFSRFITLGSTGEDVRALQKFLNNNGFIIASTGPGSPGLETAFFGQGSRAALIRFQNAFSSVILAPLGLTNGTGSLGPSTRRFINSIGQQ